MDLSAHDRRLLRDLAREVKAIAALPVMAERRRLWTAHNSLRRQRPMVLVFPEGAWGEMMPAGSCTCENEQARGIEWQLRSRIYHHQHIFDDTVIEANWQVRRAISQSGWGVTPKQHASTEARGAWSFDPVIKEPADLKKLRFPDVSEDPAKSAGDLAFAQDLFGDILNVRQVGVTHISFHLMSIYTKLRGLEQVMWDMIDEPEMLHDAMAFLEEGHHRLVAQYQAMNLFSLNNDESYHSSGGNGYTDDLPADGFDPERVRPCDIWASAEAQELAQVSPTMHEDFSLQYERRLLAPFGLNGYGCCEDLGNKMPKVLEIPNIRRVSISPFADVDECAAALGDKAIFSWKPHPSHLVGEFSEKKVREYIRHTLDVTRGAVVEMILKDTHTCENHPERFTQWTQIASELAAQY